MNEVIQYHDDDDGFGGSLTSGRLIKGQLLRWNETNGWMDRDGLRPPEILLAIALSEALQCWKGKKPVETITEKPLPDINDLNEAVPKSEWEPGLDGKPKPPWQHQVIVYLIDPTSGGFFTYLNSTIGARIAVDQLREKVITMRALRDARVVPVVKLAHRPMKTAFGMKHRPEFEVIEWRQWGGGGSAIAAPQSPRLNGPAPASAPKTIAAFTSERGAPFTTAGFRKMIARLGIAASLGFPVHPHMLRHACGFKLANDGVDTRSLQAYLGHKNIQHTVRYTELSPTRFKDFWHD